MPDAASSACQPQHRCAVALHQAGQPVVQQNGRERDGREHA